MATVGFIGLGNMGGPMASNLAKAGHKVKAFDLSEEALKAIVADGAQAAKTAAEAIDGAEFVVSMLPADRHVKGVYLGDDGLINKLNKDQLVIDCSTISSETAMYVGEQLEKAGIAFIDAPVSGGVGGAKAGTLTFICGGTETNVDRARSVLNDMGKNVFRAGDVGAGQIAKICNNMLLSVLMVGTSEALQLGKANGLDPKVLSEIMLASSGSNWTLQVYNPCPGVMDNVPSSNDYQGGFLVDLMAKDLGLAQQTALESGAATPMGSLTRNLYHSWSEQGHGRQDFSSIFNYVAPKSQK
ncbi:UNVERIFIED_ORG: 3-hydroxyisobutyrate dehydrogenase [Idiomarina abyssalis]|jgi:3-hydroxyisobutyrate dehydrogenase|uniref:3-hydroxyisobutyrate dehydrogenase n=1 Tax=Idiomarina loihiensis (strain ATCC BAA-735 / DSM 15497 / L2-TR) TaxID=283942 RepID=Q5QW22_IDILO|nr:MULTISPECIES: 3-hydroxyisobutyrate dehydrogenase [Idiomarina]AAV81707.1 3-hydroxyisobutyrate dehydrogenase [Idiomarina loihiensis L2TR]AGM35736.1 3-hydroxyisobutyrate dehydrogenase [Idiomarina loihiensis GSL 199]PHQ92177.1 MAG: 3-hydroxyisobutyrate dehydrogenase [Idiomarina sp.]PWW41388.1 3-hydroxyisobutyrate dehydrogenase [Idiomarina loihiensis]TDO53299.1 3-hydroxyisobutyrate dehydrogenase [Idiomarina sp. 017G]|tara:strand:+ start:1500 stop:2396 length:897 start_codon:yes stop_codon:yes gene_type:complete